MHTNCTVYTVPPVDFTPIVEAAGCYCNWDGKFLFLKRHPEKPQGNTWGIPGGKLDKNETPRSAVIREIQEEVGIDINDETLQLVRPLYCRFPHIDYIFYIFYKSFESMPHVEMALDEHLEFRWVTPEEAELLPLISGGLEALQYIKNSCSEFSHQILMK